jgi:TPP-dependent pyruvate/acetoin dehydrogenase alpha subunit
VLPFAGSARRGEAPAEPDAAGPDAPSAESDDAARDAHVVRELFTGLLTSRVAEDVLATLSETGRIHHPPRGVSSREAGPVGIAYAIRRATDGTGDVLAPTYRAAGALELLGLGLDDFFRAHLAGEVAASRSAHPDLHRVDLDKGILAPVVPLGLLVEVVGGLALGFRMRGEDRVAVVCDADGATSTGAWHEGLVFAAARRSPMVLVVESALDGEDLRRQTRVRSFTEKAPGYGVGSAAVDGADVLAVVETVGAAVERARNGEGVQMVEIRYTGGDPIEQLRRRMLEGGLATTEELEILEREATEACAAAAERAMPVTVPDISERFGGVYTDAAPSLRRTWSGPRITKVV